MNLTSGLLLREKKKQKQNETTESKGVNLNHIFQHDTLAAKIRDQRFRNLWRKAFKGALHIKLNPDFDANDPEKNHPPFVYTG